VKRRSTVEYRKKCSEFAQDPGFELELRFDIS